MLFLLFGLFLNVHYECTYANIECKCYETENGCSTLCNVGTYRHYENHTYGCEPFEGMFLLSFVKRG